MPEPDVRIAGPDDADGTFAVLVLAFASDPFARWITPDPAGYLAGTAEGMRAFGGRALEHGTAVIAESADGPVAAALWLPPGVEPDHAAMEARMAELPEARLADLGAIFERMALSHPEGPHWYLPLMGVDPALQGRGVGGAVMRRALERIDRDGLPAALESSNPRNVDFYRRHGFEPLDPIAVGDAPPLLPMVRPLRPRPR